MKKQAGFTLIELIMVIVILGILSAFALPRFADLSTNAEAAADQGILGAIRSASAISRSACLAGGCADAGDQVDLEGTSFETIGGYLSAGEDETGTAENGIELAAQIDGFTGVVTPRANVAWGAAGYTAGSITWTLNSCSVTYTEASDDGTTASPASITDTGC